METHEPMIFCGDAKEVLSKLPAGSVNCCVTSPPYFGLRDYGCAGQIGLEKSPEEYVAALVSVFKEVWRVLRPDGTLWLNLGDSYAGGGNGGGGSFAKDGIRSAEPGTNKNKALRIGHRGVVGVLKPKDLIGIPWRVAFALQAHGWFLRSDIIWHKPSAMPESVRDRPTRSHEYIFLLTKKKKYFYDADAIKEPSKYPSDLRKSRAGKQHKSWPSSEQNGIRQPSARWELKNNSCAPGFKAYPLRNKRDVWSVTTSNYRGAHFATFPPALIAPCILAGCPKGGVVLDPFAGSGTTGQVAQKNGRRSILIELNPEYIPLIHQRLGISSVPSVKSVVDSAIGCPT